MSETRNETAATNWTLYLAQQKHAEAPEETGGAFTDNDVEAIRNGVQALEEAGCDLLAAELEEVAARLARFISRLSSPQSEEGSGSLELTGVCSHCGLSPTITSSVVNGTICYRVALRCVCSASVIRLWPRAESVAVPPPEVEAP